MAHDLALVAPTVQIPTAWLVALKVSLATRQHSLLAGAPAGKRPDLATNIGRAEAQAKKVGALNDRSANQHAQERSEQCCNWVFVTCDGLQSSHLPFDRDDRGPRGRTQGRCAHNPAWRRRCLHRPKSRGHTCAWHTPCRNGSVHPPPAGKVGRAQGGRAAGRCGRSCCAGASRMPHRSYELQPRGPCMQQQLMVSAKVQS